VTEMTEEQKRDQDALYRAIGRYMVSFSWLVGTMERGIISISGIPGGQETLRAWHLGLAGIEANRMRELFFGVAGTALEMTEEERRIHSRLSKAVVAVIERRNSFAHGEWYVVRSTDDGGFAFDEAHVSHIKTHYLTGFVDKSEVYTAEQLEALCEEIDELIVLLKEMMLGCRAIPVT